MAATTQQYADAVYRVFTAEGIREQLLQESPLMTFDFSPEARARRHWDDAVQWLHQRKADDAEWPWPKR